MVQLNIKRSYIYIYIYIYRERERERKKELDREREWGRYIYIYIYIERYIYRERERDGGLTKTLRSDLSPSPARQNVTKGQYERGYSSAYEWVAPKNSFTSSHLEMTNWSNLFTRFVWNICNCAVIFPPEKQIGLCTRGCQKVLDLTKNWVSSSHKTYSIAP